MLKITHKHTSVIAKQTECGMHPWHTFNTNPAERMDLSALLLPLACLPTASMLDSQMSPPPSHRGPVKALGSQASVTSKVQPGS